MKTKQYIFTICFEIFRIYQYDSHGEFVTLKLFNVEAPNRLLAYNRAANQMDNEMKYYIGCSYNLYQLKKRKFKVS